MEVVHTAVPEMNFSLVASGSSGEVQPSLLWKNDGRVMEWTRCSKCEALALMLQLKCAFGEGTGAVRRSLQHAAIWTSSLPVRLSGVPQSYKQKRKYLVQPAHFTNKKHCRYTNDSLCDHHIMNERRSAAF